MAQVDANAASVAVEKPVVKAVVNEINTSLKPEIIGVAIHKIARIERDGRRYFAISALNVANNEPVRLSASVDMVEAFNLDHIIREGNYNTETERPLYLKVEVVYVPNDGNKYGNVDRDNGVHEYRNAGNYIFRNIVGTLEGHIIREAEANKYAQAYQAKGRTEEAKVYFHEMKGRNYIPGVSEDDDNFFIKMLSLVNKL